MKEAYAAFRDLKEGKNADYIPALAEVDSEWFGIVLVTADGRVFSVGDDDTLFSIRSISKVFALSLALFQSGPQSVEELIGVDATGLAFNSIVAIEEHPGIWLYKVGLPAKSGVGGGIIAVAPGQFGIAAFSPRLDPAGNSVRVQRAIQLVAERLGANPYAVKPLD